MSTPKGHPLAVPTAALARAIEAEWADIKGLPRRHQIPLTQYANTAIDHIAPAPEAALAGFLSHAQSDLLCYRADAGELVARQQTHWQPWLDWVKAETGADFVAFSGIMPGEQKPAVIAAMKGAAGGLDAFRLLALSQAAGLTGSAVLALALLRGCLEAQELMQLSLLEELFQSEQWGEPAELKEKRDSLRLELEELAQFIRLLG